ncbi:hypothetical protein EIP91_008263 [Steccherinum ochraceum]|uniref:Acid phosphatase pho5 n=1 Tax=Steccherinum ochraceum TaxID=92696 RepID=A0A4R0R336_9APHY|nr:hypothetical protein EIP91_008263 [Steccherinum ochraceum]
MAVQTILMHATLILLCFATQALAQFVPHFDSQLELALRHTLVEPLGGFNPVEHSGPASPLFTAPSQAGIPYEIPEGCTVDQAAYMVRHGDRYPEPGSLTGWQQLFAKFQNSSYLARGPLAFIPSWVPPLDDIKHETLFLDTTGAGDAFALGVRLRKRYKMTPGGANFTVWSANQQRVVDTATYFMRGYLSQGNYLNDTNLNRGTVITLVDASSDVPWADSLTPSNSCPNYQGPSGAGANNSNLFRTTFQNTTANRLNFFLDGLTLNATDVGVMQDLCGWSSEIDGDLDFCRAFEADEWRDYEYAHDLNYYYGSGPGNPVAATVGWPWLKAVTDLFQAGPGKTVANGTLTPPPLIMTFTHDNNLPPVMAALGAWNSTVTLPGQPETIYPLPIMHRVENPARQFHASYIVSFTGNLALERMTCVVNGPTLQEQKLVGNFHQANVLGGNFNLNLTGSMSQPMNQTFVRLRTNDAPIPLPNCTSGPGQTCPLEQFIQSVNGPRAAAAGNFQERCGLQNVTGVISNLTFLTTAGDGVSMLIPVAGTPAGLADVP